MTKLPEIALPPQLKERLAQGHPWVYRTHIPPNVRLPSGAWVRARCGGWSGYGLWDAERPIAIRIFSERQQPDADWLRERVRAAWELRAPLREAGCTAYRWLFGEGDGLPGLTVSFTATAPGSLAQSTPTRRRVLVTGAAGNIGKYFAEHSHEQYELRIMVHPG